MALDPDTCAQPADTVHVPGFAQVPLSGFPVETGLTTGFRLYEGTSQIHQLVIAGETMKRVDERPHQGSLG